MLCVLVWQASSSPGGGPLSAVDAKLLEMELLHKQVGRTAGMGRWLAALPWPLMTTMGHHPVAAWLLLVLGQEEMEQAELEKAIAMSLAVEEERLRLLKLEAKQAEAAYDDDAPLQRREVRTGGRDMGGRPPGQGTGVVRAVTSQAYYWC